MVTALKTPMDNVARAFEILRRGYGSELNPSAAVREDRLQRLEKLIIERRSRLVEAIDADFGGRSEHETLLADIVLTLDSVRHARRSVADWMRSQARAPSPYFQPSRAHVEYLPKGVVAIIAPWNYPVNLALAPLAGALAAGNRTLLKPSELTPRTAAVLAEAVRETFSSEEVAVVEGGPEVAAAVTRLPLDHLLFTGSTAVGRKVAAAGADNLTPLTLELGGKSPALIHPDYPMDRAAERIALGKLFNAGQTCIAPDYVVVQRGTERVFAEGFRQAVERHYPNLLSNRQYTSVINARHRARLQALLDDAEAKGARLEVVSPGRTPTPGSQRMAPTLVSGVTNEMAIMTEEIFGPILPILAVGSTDEALAYVRSRPHPLAFYYFDDNQTRASGVFRQTLSGGACLNDCLVHFAQENLPFGGVGASGIGAYHGFAGFETFSHRRGVLMTSSLSPARHLQAPPYGKALSTALDVMIGSSSPLPGERMLRDALHI